MQSKQSKRTTTKAKRPPCKRKPLLRTSKKIKKGPCKPKPENAMLCKHHSSTIEFLCTNDNCLQELCGHCILQHTHHISQIHAIKEILSRASKDTNNIVDPLNIISRRNHSEKRLGDTEQRLKRVVEGEVQKYRNQLIEMASNEEEAVRACEGMKVLQSSIITQKGVELLKSSSRYLKFSKIPPANTIKVEEELLVEGMKECLSQNIGISKEGCLLESFNENFPKLLHWFEWGKKKLNVYDIIKNRTISYELQIPFKIPGFSRSIILPNCKIYLIGGEEPEYFSRKEVYCFDISEMPVEPKFIQQASMPHKKFDFTLCYLSPFIYVLCGKDSQSEVVSTCERYNVQEDKWEKIAEANKKRYAGSAIGVVSQNKVFLFGGRSDYNNTMVPEIEEYSIDENVWTIVVIKNGVQLWQPVEVCACIQISRENILIFGGSDEKIKDSHITLNFNVTSYSFQKKNNLQRPQVFVTAPVLYGKYVYGVGNEYYLKQRNLHRYSLEEEEWDIIF